MTISHDEAAVSAGRAQNRADLDLLTRYVAEQREAEKKYEALTKAVLATFEARESGMETIEERIDMARAVASLQGTKTVAYLTFEDQCDIAEDEIEWDPAVDGELDDDAVKSPSDDDDEGGT